MISLSDIGSQLRAQRKGLHLTQAQLAEKSGISRAMINLIENGNATDLGYSKLTRLLATVGLEFTLTATPARRPTLSQLLSERDDQSLD